MSRPVFGGTRIYCAGKLVTGCRWSRRATLRGLRAHRKHWHRKHGGMS